MRKLNSTLAKSEASASDQPLEELYSEIQEAKTIDQCLTLARLYLKRAKELSRHKPGVFES